MHIKTHYLMLHVHIVLIEVTTPQLFKIRKVLVGSSSRTVLGTS